MRPRAITPPRPHLTRVLLVVTGAVVLVAATAPSAVRADAPEPTGIDDLADTPCPDPLVVHRPDGSIGAMGAVTITSQAIARDEPGWASVGWQAAPGTRLTTVVVTTASGVQRRTGEPSGTASQVLELAFCGTHDPGGSASDGDEDGAAVAAGRTESVRFDSPSVATSGTFPASVFAAALGLTVGGVVLLMSRSARRDREATR